MIDSTRSGRSSNPPRDVAVRIGESADDVYQMCGWTDARGYHPGDGIPTLLGPGGRWTLWYLTRRRADGKPTLTSAELCTCDEDEATALAVLYLLTYEHPNYELVGRAA